MRTDDRDPRESFLGVGWAFPPRLNADGSIAMAVYEEDIRQAIRIILATEPGERQMRPDFGAGLRRFVFEPLSTTLLALIRTRVQEALVDWEPRIDVEEVQTRLDPQDRNLVRIDVTYKVRTTNTLHNLVYPLYLEEGGQA
jgi:phage baseplate assembly protein W